jgi:hypothetical protein
MVALNRWQRSIVDGAGNVLPDASVEVRREDTGVLQSLFSDLAGTTPIGNPFTADGDGFAAFHAADGLYKITATSGALSAIWRYVKLGASVGGRQISTTDTILPTDNGSVVEIVSGTFSLAFTAVATLGTEFWCIVQNSGTGVVTLDPASAEQIDGLATWKLYPGGAILVRCTGATLESTLLAPMLAFFAASDTFTKPGVGTFADVFCWGAGGSGGRGGTGEGGGGGGGGSHVRRRLTLSTVGATETVTIGAGGTAITANDTNGVAGGNTSFGAHVVAYGGGGGAGAGGSGNGGGGGGGRVDAGSTATDENGDDGGNTRGSILAAGGASIAAAAGIGGGAGIVGSANAWGGGGGGGGNTAGAAGGGGAGLWGGAGGGGGAEGGNGGAGGTSWYGAGGGGGGSSGGTPGSGGGSVEGGVGGAGATGANNATAGSVLGGGGGGSVTGNSGAGGIGRCIVYIW